MELFDAVTGVGISTCELLGLITLKQWSLASEQAMGQFCSQTSLLFNQYQWFFWG